VQVPLPIGQQHPEVQTRMFHTVDRELESADRAIDSHIKNIRRKFVAIDSEANFVASVYGAGYRFEVE
jgi:DNA-binding response OmpR family regulator